MRVFLPSTLPALAEALRAGQVGSGAGAVPGHQVKLDARDREPARVLVTAATPIDTLASAHVDDTEATQDVRSAAEALDAADSGDEDARFAVDGAEGHELAWYATQELSDLAE